MIILLMNSCGPKIDVEQANQIAEEFIQQKKHNSTSWYIGQTESKGSNWIVFLQVLGDDCEKELLYIDKQSGEIEDVVNGNEC